MEHPSFDGSKFWVTLDKETYESYLYDFRAFGVVRACVFVRLTQRDPSATAPVSFSVVGSEAKAHF